MEVSGIYTMQQRLFHKKEKSPETALNPLTTKATKNVVEKIIQKTVDV
jgi:hypothetical protein